MVRGIRGQHWTMAGELHLNVARRLALDLDRLVNCANVVPAISKSVLVRIVGVERLDIQIFLIHREDRQPKRDLVVVADRDSGQRRLARADDVEPGGIELDDIAQRWDAVVAMGIIG